ncbi:WXG100 family type VII secretion target [Nocardia jiangxiensis]|uniref:WXG100 family type VII secretion target n=1 Tax=Nocardia jiangxiensis TaxID=282685 RepID=A0ABW6S0S3_9NOCA|nr:hypothetical protein [Nocardia jiangxiensis]
MGESLRIDADLASALATELSSIADATQQDLNQLRDALDREGECWGDDEPGHVFAEGYAPAAKNGLTSFQNLADNLRALGKNIGDATETIRNQDQLGAQQLRNQGSGSDYVAPQGTSPNQVGQQQPTTVPAATPTSGDTTSPTSATASPSPDATTGSGDIAAPGDTAVDPGSPVYQPNTGPDVPTTSPSVPSGPGIAPQAAGQQAPTSATETVAPQSSRAPQAVSSPDAASAAPKDTSAAPAGSSSRVSSSESPWSSAKASPQRNAPGTPWAPNSPGNPAPGQVLPPRRRAPGRIPPKPEPAARPKRGTAQPARVSVGPERTGGATARALADRHDLNLVGFDSGDIDGTTVQEIAAAVDAMLERHPFLVLAGIEITELTDGAVSRVVPAPTGRKAAGAKAGARILLDRATITDHDRLSEKIRTTTQSGESILEFEARPVYSTMIHAFGRIMEISAGPQVRGLAQRSLIAEYQRISGPWHGTETLAGVVGGYRRWRSQLSSRSFVDGRFHPRDALVAAFAEVELRGEHAGAPARVLHRLIVERASERANSP